jgi:hypothetical protein
MSSNQIILNVILTGKQNQVCEDVNINLGLIISIFILSVF